MPGFYAQLNLAATTAAAGALQETTIATGLSVQPSPNLFGYQVRRIELNFPVMAALPEVDGRTQFHCSLSRRSISALGNWDRPQTFFFASIDFHSQLVGAAATLVGVNFTRQVVREYRDDDLLLVEPNIFMAVQSDAIWGQNTVLGRIFYTLERISPLLQQQVINLSL